METTYIHGTRKEEQGRLSTLNRITNNSFISYLGLRDEIKVCDFGCGLGNLIRDIDKRFPYVEITGVEISEEQYLKARKLNKNNNKVTLVNASIFQNNLPDNYFDITYCRYLLEHVNEPVRAVQEMVRVTKPGGKIISQENDLHNVMYFPEIPHYDYVMQRFCNLQVQMGGDPFIGRKLFTIYKQAKVVNIELAYEPEIYTENDTEKYKAWLKNSLDIFLGVKEELLCRNMIDEKIFDNVCGVLQTRIQTPVGVSLFHWNRITGHKAR